jgi:hypothetical protein
VQYKALEARPSGWRGERDFILKKKEVLGDDTVEFTYEPASTPDGKPAAFGFNAGQYTTVRIPGLECSPRHYTVTSLVNADTMAYTCRKVKGGAMSTYMHEKLQVRPATFGSLHTFSSLHVPQSRPCRPLLSPLSTWKAPLTTRAYSLI